MNFALEDQRRRNSNHSEQLFQLLKSKLDGEDAIYSSRISGSVAKNYDIVSCSDVDLLLVLAVSSQISLTPRGSHRGEFLATLNGEEYSSKEVLGSFHRAMLESDPLKRVSRHTVSISCVFREETDFDVIPLLRHNEEEYIPSSRGTPYWEKSHREKEMSEANEYGSRYPEFRRALRLLKTFGGKRDLFVPGFVWQELLKAVLDRPGERYESCYDLAAISARDLCRQLRHPTIKNPYRGSEMLVEPCMRRKNYILQFIDGCKDLSATIFKANHL